MEHKLDPDVLRVELRYFIDNASEQELEDLYAFVNSKTPPYEWWNDEEMMAELDQISADMESGKDKGVPWEEVKAHLLNKLKKDEL